MKKLLSIFLVICLVLITGNSQFVSAKKSSNSSLDLNEQEIEQLLNLGYSEKQIQLMDEDEYERVKDEKGKILEKDTMYLKLEKGKKPQKITEEQALKEVKEHMEKMKKKKKSNSEISIKSEFDSSTEETSWMRVTLLVTQYTDDAGERTGIYRLKYDWEWLTDPIFALTDVIAISHPEYLTNDIGSEYSKYIYGYDKFGSIVNRSDYKESADLKNSNGMAFKVDLLSAYNGFDVVEHSGYMYYRVELSNYDYNPATAYGHYTHVEGDILGLTLNLFNGNLSVGGVLKSTEMRDVGVNFRTQN